MDDAQIKAELSAPGEGFRAAVELFDAEFERAMARSAGDITAALGLLWDKLRADPNFGGAVAFRFLAAFGSEARAAQSVLAMSVDQRARYTEKLFSDRFQEALKMADGNLDGACGQLLQEGLCDAEFNAAVVANHIAYFKESLVQRPRGEGTSGGAALRPN